MTEKSTFSRSMISWQASAGIDFFLWRKFTGGDLIPCTTLEAQKVMCVLDSTHFTARNTEKTFHIYQGFINIKYWLLLPEGQLWMGNVWQRIHLYVTVIFNCKHPSHNLGFTSAPTIRRRPIRHDDNPAAAAERQDRSPSSALCTAIRPNFI